MSVDDLIPTERSKSWTERSLSAALGIVSVGVVLAKDTSVNAEWAVWASNVCTDAAEEIERLRACNAGFAAQLAAAQAPYPVGEANREPEWSMWGGSGVVWPGPVRIDPSYPLKSPTDRARPGCQKT